MVSNRRYNVSSFVNIRPERQQQTRSRVNSPEKKLTAKFNMSIASASGFGSFRAISASDNRGCFEIIVALGDSSSNIHCCILLYNLSTVVQMQILEASTYFSQIDKAVFSADFSHAFWDIFFFHILQIFFETC